MYQRKSVFAQIEGFLPQGVFDRIADLHEGNKYVKHLTCRYQLLCMTVGQLTNRDSHQDLMMACCLAAIVETELK
jgi:hypothetical protein